MQSKAMIDLEALFAFEAWAREHGMDVASTGDGVFVEASTQLAWEGYRAAVASRAADHRYPKLLARIRPKSKYAYQAERMVEKGERYPFPIALAKGHGGYVVQGGLGGCYRLEDVDLIAVVDGEELQLNGRRSRK